MNRNLLFAFALPPGFDARLAIRTEMFLERNRPGQITLGLGHRLRGPGVAAVRANAGHVMLGCGGHGRWGCRSLIHLEQVRNSSTRGAVLRARRAESRCHSQTRRHDQTERFNRCLHKLALFFAPECCPDTPNTPRTRKPLKDSSPIKVDVAFGSIGVVPSARSFREASEFPWRVCQGPIRRSSTPIPRTGGQKAP